MPKNYVFGKFKSFLISLTKIATGIVGVLSFGNYSPTWDTDLIGYFMIEYFDKYK